jgi:hypothetical protein
MGAGNGPNAPSRTGAELPIPSMMEANRITAATSTRRATAAGVACVALVAYALGWFISSSVTARAESTAQQHATFVGGLIADDLEASSVTSPERRTFGRLEHDFSQSLLDGAVVGVRLRRFDGTVLMSSGEVPSSLAGSILPRAFEGRPVSERAVSSSGAELFGSYIPLELEGDGGTLVAVAEVYQDGHAVTAGFDGLRWTLIPATVLGLALLYALLQRVWRAAAAQPEGDVRIFVLGESDAAA